VAHGGDEGGNVIEAGLVVDLDGEPLHWHLPPGRSGGSLPDSRELWDVIWANRQRISGIAHSHPGHGIPGPSHQDVTTFSAVDLALGRRLQWWITSADRVVLVRWRGPGSYDYETEPLESDPRWVDELRRLSQ
jgi:hypothetical protein